MDRCAVFVDAGYLYGASSSLLADSNARRTLRMDQRAMVESLRALAEAETGLPLLRIYWYDAARNKVPEPEQRTLSLLPGVKLRLGSLRRRTDGSFTQKGVDTDLHADMTELARNGGAADFVLLSGDEDLLRAVDEVQGYGVRVHLWGVDARADTFNQSLELSSAADRRHQLDEAFLRRFFEVVPDRVELNAGIEQVAAATLDPATGGHGGAAVDGVEAAGTAGAAAESEAGTAAEAARAAELDLTTEREPSGEGAAPAEAAPSEPSAAEPFAEPTVGAGAESVAVHSGAPDAPDPLTEPLPDPERAGILAALDVLSGYDALDALDAEQSLDPPVEPAAEPSAEPSGGLPAEPLVVTEPPGAEPLTDPLTEPPAVDPGQADRSADAADVTDPASAPEPPRPTPLAFPTKPAIGAVVPADGEPEAGGAEREYLKLSELSTRDERHHDAEEDVASGALGPEAVGRRYGVRWRLRATQFAVQSVRDLPAVPRSIDSDLLRYAERMGIDTWHDEQAKFAVRDGFLAALRDPV